MGSFRELIYGIHNDYTRNRWIRGSENSDYYGLIMMFHNVTDEPNESADDCNCTICDFYRILEQYNDAGFTFVSVGEALGIVKNKIRKRFVVVTFDDIPDNVYINAYPVLKNMNIPFTVFITVGFIGREGFITKDQLCVLSNDPLCSIGAHTMTHPMLRLVDNSLWEIEQSKKELERIVGKKVSCFAYPYGRYSAVSSQVIEEVRSAGYECAFSSISAPLTESSSNDVYFLPRIVAKPEKMVTFTKSWSIIKILSSLFKRSFKHVLR